MLQRIKKFDGRENRKAEESSSPVHFFRREILTQENYVAEQRCSRKCRMKKIKYISQQESKAKIFQPFLT